MKRILVGIAATLLAVSGCTSTESAGSDAAAAAGASGASSSVQSSNRTTDSGFVAKQVNEEARGGCSAEGAEDCDVVFKVTELQRGYECSGYVPEIADGDEPLLVRVEAEMAPNFQYEHSDNLLHYQHWGVMDADGYYIQSPESNYCPDLDFDLGQLYPGTKARGALLLSVPEGSKTLRLGMLQGSGGWEWEIPA